MNELPYIIAIDFDGTLVEDKFPNIGSINTETWNKAIEAKENGVKLILWTCRNNEVLDNAVKFCTKNGLEFDAINTNLPEIQALYGGDTRKVFANEYWDDKGIKKFCTHTYTRQYYGGGEVVSQG